MTLPLIKTIRDAAIKYKVFIFPLVLFVILIGLTSLRISGSSVGMYHQFLYGSEAKDPNLIFGHPQSIRSDEWLVNTQITIAQSYEGFPHINHNFLDGKDMSVTFDVPYKDWSAGFKPQNLSFFVLPLENALAFKWWFVLFALIVSVYVFVLKLLNKKILIAILIAMLTAFSPFVFWWYQTNIIAYGFIIISISMSIINGNELRLFRKRLDSKVSAVLKSVVLSYVLICFALTLYPPFQVAVALVVAAFLFGYLINHLAGKPKRKIVLTLLPFVVSIILTGVVCGAYITTRSDAVRTIANTVYPGKRSVNPGGYDINKLLVTYLQPELQSRMHGSKYDKNQSESSNFIVMPIFFIAPSFVLLRWLYKRTGKIDWVLVSLLICLLIFSLHMFIPQAGLITKIFFLTYVPQSRLIIGFGFLAIILLTYMIHLSFKHHINLSRKSIAALTIYSAVFLLFMILGGFETAKQYPDFVSSKKIIILLAAIVMLGQYLLIINKIKLGLFVLAAFSVGSVILVNPLYVGIGPLYKSDVSQEIEKLSTKNDTWAAAENIVIENLPQASDRHAITGVSGYPSLSFWQSNIEAKDYSNVYNRYAHIFLTSNSEQSLLLLGPDLFAVSGACGQRIDATIDYIVSVAPLKGGCYELRDTIKYPAMSFYYYKVRH